MCAKLRPWWLKVLLLLLLLILLLYVVIILSAENPHYNNTDAADRIPNLPRRINTIFHYSKDEASGLIVSLLRPTKWLIKSNVPLCCITYRIEILETLFGLSWIHVPLNSQCLWKSFCDLSLLYDWIKARHQLSIISIIIFIISILFLIFSHSWYFIPKGIGN